jgi:hypothetical protein
VLKLINGTHGVIHDDNGSRVSKPAAVVQVLESRAVVMATIHKNKVKLFVRIGWYCLGAIPWNKLKPTRVVFSKVPNPIGSIPMLINIKARHRDVRAARQKHLTTVTSIEPNLHDRLDVILTDELTNSLNLLRIILHMALDVTLTMLLHILGQGLHTES